MPWSFLLIGYCITVLIETPILLAGLSAPHHFGRRLFAGLWLTACIYPVVILVLPCLLSGSIYLAVAETFAPVAECTLFLAAFGVVNRSRWETARDCVAIVIANLASFGLGECMHGLGWFDALA